MGQSVHRWIRVPCAWTYLGHETVTLEVAPSLQEFQFLPRRCRRRGIRRRCCCW
ncbi:hypothetical protein G7085_07225 [Tessaracoccus sp. HDW20]|uniref:hypothetical protein n=1 Tax=Tessaracoccus coleopterorum TaxID=2714950 RepID=UPI0018D306B4|nr:hypothetical protein [Tessaracoccus coleopterorum]NHB84466.1 hypothetical protein [Tessaracoccus coleopterorum]